MIALEPEAASIYCQYLPTDRLLGSDASTEITIPGVKYLVVDLGGTFIDNTPHIGGSRRVFLGLEYSFCCKIK